MNHVDSFDMGGNEITNCKTINDLKKRIAELERQLAERPIEIFTKEEIFRLKRSAKRIR